MNNPQHYFNNRVKFSQLDLINKGYLNKDGSSIGIVLDWFKYTDNHPNSSYINDKYINKFMIGLDFEDGVIKFIDSLDSYNFYNRLNCYEFVASKISYNIGYDWSYSDINKNSPAKSIIHFGNSNTYMAYEITEVDSGFYFKLFDPNYGEFTSEKLNSQNDAFNEINGLIEFLRQKYADSGILLAFESIISNPDELVYDIDNIWKYHKNDIEDHGVSDNSMNYQEFVDTIEWQINF